MDLFKAYNQWATRPNDERFWTMQDMATQCRAYRETAVTSTVNYRDLRVEARKGELVLVGKTGVAAQLTNYAFGQLNFRTRGPQKAWLSEVPATLAAQVLNHGLKERSPKSTAHLLFHRNGGGMLLRAALSKRYERIWNHEIIERLLDILPDGWRVPPARPVREDSDPRARPATEADLLDAHGGMRTGMQLSIQLGDMIAPAGLYASDHDMFVFLVNEKDRVNDGTETGLAKFAMLWNSEVGDKAIGGIFGLYDHVCGNHICWGAKDVAEWSFRHVGKVRDKAFPAMKGKLVRYDNENVSDTEAKIKKAQTFEIASTKEEVVSTLLGLKLPGINEDRLGAAYDLAEKHEDWYNAPPTSAWGMVNGLTEVSQKTPFAAERVKLDRAASKVMKVAF